jgi:two-component system, cell cycle sensor histidine kinase and response regulator CckA
MANANQIQQVLDNLITNAWEAAGENEDSIRVNIKVVSPVEIPATNRFPIAWQPQDSAYACLEVTDTGSGIASDDLDKLFDPFFSNKFTGRGLGLPVVLGIVKGHGGVVTVESELGHGSTFRIFLPLAAEEAAHPALDKESPAPEIEGGGTVLLVDNEEMMRNMAAAMLKCLGFSVLEAKDGVEAVEVFRQHQHEIRCVLCDLTMPRLDGWDTLPALRKLAPDFPVILTSGYDRAHVMSGEHPEWPQVFLDKPYTLKGLSEAINQALVGKK